MRQHARNPAAAQPGVPFVAGGALDIPLPDASVDVARLLEWPHHVPMPQLAQTGGDPARALRPLGRRHMSEPVSHRPPNEVIRLLYSIVGIVRAAAQAAVDAALGTGAWRPVAERYFDMPVCFKDSTDLEQRMIRPAFADHVLPR